MTTRFAFLIGALIAGCGDNLEGAPDAGGGGDGGGSDGSMEVCTRAIAPEYLDGGTYDNRFTVAGVSGMDGLAPTIYDFATDTDGSIVAAGKFQYFGGQRVEPLLRYRNGAWAPARTTWELDPPGAGFSAVAINTEGDMALATYDDFGARDGEIWIDDGTGLRVIGSFEGLVRRMVWYQNKLWVAGWMTIDAPTDVSWLAVWNGTTWSAPPGGAVVGDAVYELRLDGTGLLVGGKFTNIGGVATQNAASFNGTTWSSLTFPNVTIYSLVRDNGTLYAGGSFGTRFGAAGGIARRVGNAWQLFANGLVNSGIIGVATDVVPHAGSLYVTGCFFSAGGAEGDTGAVVANGIARYDGAWHSLDDATSSTLSPWFQPRACGDIDNGFDVFDVNNQRLYPDGTRLLLGGNFPGIAGVESQALIVNDGTNWVAQGTAQLGLGGNFESVAASETCEVYASSEKDFLSHVSGQKSTTRMYRFTGTEWAGIDDSVIPDDAFCPTGVKVSKSGTAVIGCLLFPATGDPEGVIYKVSGNSLVEAVDGLPLLQAIAFDDDENLWIGGSTIDGAGAVAKWDGTTATIIEDGFDGAVGVIDPVSATEVIVAGQFTKVGTVDVLNVARLTGTTWTPLGAGVPGMPSALAHDGARVYISSYDVGDGGFNLGRFEGGTWTELATAGANLTRNSDFSFYAIRPVGDAVLIAGSGVLDDESGRGALVYRNGAFTALGGGVNASSLKDIAITSDAIWVAGSIAEAGAGAGLVSTVGIARYEIAER